MDTGGVMSGSGALGVRKIGARMAPIGWRLRNALRWSYLRGWIGAMLIVPLANFFGLLTGRGELGVRVRFLDPAARPGYLALRDATAHLPPEEAETQLEAYRRAHGAWVNYGTVSYMVNTDAGVAYLVDDMDNAAGSADISLFNFHGIGTGTNAEAVGDTALQTESTTALNPDSTRATGTRSQPAANQYRSVGTLTADASIAVTEHGLLTQAATGGGTLWDRSVFSVINLASGDSIQTTFTQTWNSGG